MVKVSGEVSCNGVGGVDLLLKALLVALTYHHTSGALLCLLLVFVTECTFL
jgi:hypothetical protein